MNAHNFVGDRVQAEKGDVIWFKSDIEQASRVKETRYGGPFGKSPQVRVDVRHGEYRGKNQWIDLELCWNQ